MWEAHGTLFISIGFFVAGYLVGWRNEWIIKRRIIRNAAADLWRLQDENTALKYLAGVPARPRARPIPRP